MAEYIVNSVKILPECQKSFSWGSENGNFPGVMGRLGRFWTQQYHVNPVNEIVAWSTYLTIKEKGPVLHAVYTCRSTVCSN